jgi:DNA polymerase-3 subunit delta'
MELYPWQSAVWQKLLQARARMPHALLLQGRGGIGKRDFAQKLAQSLLCDQPLPDHTACGSCGSCGWFAQDNHPDFRLLEPEDRDAGDEAAGEAKGGKKTQISVDQVRELADFLTLSSHRAGLRIVLLCPAEALNPASANALLKMLEEPPPAVIFLLVTHQPQRLLATIRSRCSKIAMPVPPRELAEAWLERQGVARAAEQLAFAGGAPLLAMNRDDESDRRLLELQAMLAEPLSMDPLAAAAHISREGMVLVIDALQKWTCDLLMACFAGEVRYHRPQAAAMQHLAKGVDLTKLLDYQRVLNEARRVSLHPLNNELQTESLMIQYTQLFSLSSKP